MLSSLLLSPVSGSYYAQVCRADRIVELVLNETSNLYEYQQVNTTSASDDENDNETRTQFRECNCPRPISHPHSVCPIDTSICGIPNDTKEPILCFQDDTAVILVRNVSEGRVDVLFAVFEGNEHALRIWMKQTTA